MGRYLNPGNAEFCRAVNSEIYIDKSMLLEYTNRKMHTEQGFICVSRPRRFGKSMTANMLAAYYSRGCDSKELFLKLKFSESEGFEKNLNRFNVIYIKMLDELNRAGSIEKMMEYIEKRLIWELRKEYGEVECFDWEDLVTVLESIFYEKKQPFIFIIDEWDCVFREQKEDRQGQKNYLDVLRFWLKDKAYVALAYMTGILPIKKYGRHSALNMFDEYSMTNQMSLGEFTGFTEEEVRTLCEKYSMSFSEAKRWYDGYELRGISVYNPRSVVAAMMAQCFDSYWTKTETYESLKKYIQMDSFGLKSLVTRLIAGEHLPINPDKFQNDMTTFHSADDVFTLLVHLGYLTYDFDTRTIWIPNYEVQREFINSIEDGGWEHIMSALAQSEKLLKATLSMDTERVADIVEALHRENASILQYNNENSLSCVLSLAYYAAKKDYVMYRELQGGDGFADLVFLPRKNCMTPALIVELKWNKSAKTAISQIKEKKYVESLKDYTGELLLVGLSYDKESRKHECVIERKYLQPSPD